VPEGGHSTHLGALLEGAIAALPEDPPEPAREDDVTPVPLAGLDWLPEMPPVDAAPPVDPGAEPPPEVVVLVPVVNAPAPTGLP
jgi:hypothetical protein